MMTSLDYIIVVMYLVAAFGVATYFARNQGIESFLVNKRQTKLAFLVFSIVSTNVGAGFFQSVASEAYASGISFGVTMIIVSTATCFTFAALSRRVKSLADQGKASTIPELLSQRYGSRYVGWLAGMIVVVGYLFVTALQFLGVGSVASAVLDVHLREILLIAGLVTVAYSAIGGLRSDMIADAFSFMIMVVTLALVVPLVAVHENVSWSQLPPAHLNLFAFAGAPFFFLSVLLAVASAFMFMEMWQRVFAAESATTARRAFVISALVQPIFIGIAIFLGLSASLLYKNIDKNAALFAILKDFLPAGLLGLGLVAILAILMTTVNSLVVVGGTTLFIDLVKPIIRVPTARSELRWVRIMTICFGIASLALAFVLPDLVKLLLMGAFIMLPMCPAIIWGLFAKRLHASSAIASMIVGVVTTLCLLRVMPSTAFGPGFLVAFLPLVVGSLCRLGTELKEEACK